MASKRVLYVIASLQGGAATHLFDLAKGARDSGWEVEVVAPEDEPVLAEKMLSEGIQLTAMPIDSGFRPTLLLGLESLIRSREGALVHVHGLRAGLYGRLAAAYAGRSEITAFTVHGYHVPYYEKRWKRVLAKRLERFLSPYAGLTVCVSESDRASYCEQIVGHDAPWVRLVRNGIDVDAFQCDLSQAEARRRLGFPSDAFILGCASRLRPQKDPATLIRAFAEFRKKHPRAILAFAGEGPMREEMIGLARRLGVVESVRFFSTVKNMPEFYRSLDLFCLTSRWEGLPLSLMEAMAAGVPVVATEVAGTTEVISNHESGLLSPPGDAEAFAKALHCAATNPSDSQRMARNAQERVRRLFGKERMVMETLDIYEEMLSGFKNA